MEIDNGSTHLWQTRRYNLLIWFLFLYIFISLLLRITLFCVFGLHNGATWLDLPAILSVGIVNDSIEGLYLLLPYSLYLWLTPEKWYARKWHTTTVGIISYFLIFGLIYLSSVQFYFFQEFGSRLNLVAVDYLIYPNEVFINIWDSYPVIKILLACLIASIVAMIWIWKKYARTKNILVQFKKRTLLFSSHLLLLILCGLLINVHSFDFSDNRIVNEISANGIGSFFQAFRTNKLNYMAYYKTGNSEAMLQTLAKHLSIGGGKFIALKQGMLNRLHNAKAGGLGKLNVVVIVEESLSAKYVGAYHLKYNFTPNLDRLAKQGLLFKNAYAVGTRTVRGLEAISTSLPPIPGESIIKRQGSEHIANWGAIMKQHGYTTSFLYGGYGLFDNMNHFFSNNGFEISDRSNIKHVTFSTIWGVSDGNLFNHAIHYFNKINTRNKPFFAILMTTSNHLPFLFPKGIPEVEPKHGGRVAGARYADYALGQFITEAKKQPWFKNTVFVIVADHDARVYGRKKIPVSNYRIPLIIYSPAHLKPKEITTPTSQIDIAPTILGLLGFQYEAPFFGQDVLHWPANKPRDILMSHDHDVGLLQGDTLVTLGLLKKAETYHYDSTTTTLTKIKQNNTLLQLAIAYYQVAYELFNSHRYVIKLNTKNTVITKT